MSQPNVNSTLPEVNDALFACDDETKYDAALIDAIFFRFFQIGADLSMRRGGDGCVYAHPYASADIRAGFPVGIVYDAARPSVVELTDDSYGESAEFIGFCIEDCSVGAQAKVVVYGPIRKAMLTSSTQVDAGDGNVKYASLALDASGTVYACDRMKAYLGPIVGYVLASGDVFVSPFARLDAPTASREKIKSPTSSPTTCAKDDTCVLCDTSARAYTVNLPISPMDGQRVTVKDSGANAATNNITIASLQSIETGYTTITTNRGVVRLVYSATASKWYGV